MTSSSFKKSGTKKITISWLHALKRITTSPITTATLVEELTRSVDFFPFVARAYDWNGFISVSKDITSKTIWNLLFSNRANSISKQALFTVRWSLSSKCAKDNDYKRSTYKFVFELFALDYFSNEMMIIISSWLAGSSYGAWLIFICASWSICI